MSNISANFSARVLDVSGVVKSSIRRGHNVLTAAGETWLRDLVRWGTIGGAGDVLAQNDRLRWVMLGSGSQPELKSVAGLVSPLAITAGVYLRALPAPEREPASVARYLMSFTGVSTDFDHLGPTVIVSEAGLFVDEDSGSGPGLDVSLSDHVPVAYKTFEPIEITTASFVSLDLVWEFRF